MSHLLTVILDTTLCDKVCQWLATGRWFSLETQVSINSYTNKTDHHGLTEILLKVALYIITLILTAKNMKYTQLNKNNELTAISLQADMEIPVPSICFKAYSLPSELQSK